MTNTMPRLPAVLPPRLISALSPRLSLRAHLLALVAATLVPMILLCAALATWLADERRASIELGLVESTRAMAIAVDRELAGHVAALEVLAASEALARGNLAAFHQKAAEAQREHPGWERVVLVAPDGQQAVDTSRPPGSTLARVAHLPLVREVFSGGRPVVSGLSEWPMSPKPGVSVAIPVVQGGRVAYALSAVLSSSIWTRMLDEFAQEPGMLVHLSDHHRRLVARVRGDETGEYVGRAAPEWLSRAIDAAPAGVASGRTLDGRPVVGAFRRLRTADWALFVALPAETVDVPIARTVSMAFGVSALVAFGAFVVSVLVGRRIAGSVAKLAAAGRLLAAGEPLSRPVDVPVSEVDHLWGVLSDASSAIVGAARAAQDAEARYRSIVDTAVDAMVVIDTRRVVQSFNKAAETIFGYAAAEVVGRNVSMLMPEPYRSEHDGYVERHMATGERRIIGVGREVTGLRKDGSTFPLELSVARWSAGGALFFTGIMRDVTERRRAEGTLRETADRLALALEGARAGTWTYDIRADRHLWSEDKRRMVGLDRADEAAEALGHSAFLGMIHPGDRSRVGGEIERALHARSEDINIEYRIGHPAKGTRWISSRGKVHYGPDGPVVTGLSFDVTDRKRMEQVIAAAKDEAERANQTKTRFLAAASHDLRQPLQSMFFVAGALSAHVGPGGRAHFGLLMRGMDALKALLDSLFDVSRLDSGVINVDVGDLDVGDLIGEIASSYAPIAEAKGLRFRSGGDCRWIGRSDRTLLGRIVRNLVENAIRYTAAGEVGIDCRTEDGRIVIEVRDTGPGIPPEHLDRIWEEFHQVGNPERDRSQGLGLGLAIVQRVSRILGHRIEVSSKPGAGSVFSVSVPLVRQASAPEPGAVPMEEGGVLGIDGGGRLALAVDDDMIVLRGLEAVLDALGYRVVAASSLEEALRAVEEDGLVPDIIISDYRLGGSRRGTDAVEIIRDRVGAKVPAIILTGEANPERKADIAASGLGIARKPLSPRELHDAIETQISAAA